MTQKCIQHNEGKPVVAGRSIRTNTNIKYINVGLQQQKMCQLINQLTQLMNKTIKMKLTDIKSNTNIEFNKKNNKDPTFKVGDHVRISKYKNICANAYVQNWSEKDFVIKKV